MIVRYKASEATDAQPISAETVTLSTYRAMAKVTKQRSCNAEGKSSRSMSDQMSNLRVASDTTRGALQMPEAAPLIYPDLDHKLAQEGPESFKDKSKDAKKFVADYIDRRAQMSFVSARRTAKIISQADTPIRPSKLLLLVLLSRRATMNLPLEPQTQSTQCTPAA